MPTFYNSTAMNKSQIMASREDRYDHSYAKGGRVGAKDGRWIQKATKNMRKDKPCTGKKFGSKSCPPGSKRYNLAKTFKKMAKKRKG
jgi:hypothetical protein|tara:strand:- start:347 stop:607 length:261 start_codon:yes stop_codon:yes gene_type:complete